MTPVIETIPTRAMLIIQQFEVYKAREAEAEKLALALAVQNETAQELVAKKPFFERLPFLGKAVIGLNRRQFEGRLGKLIGSALAHEQEGLAPGSAEYVRLGRMADENIASYCLGREINRADLEAQIPAMNKLRNLAVPPPAKAPAWMSPGTILVVSFLSMFFAILLGANCGLFAAARAFTIHLLVR